MASVLIPCGPPPSDNRTLLLRAAYVFAWGFLLGCSVLLTVLSLGQTGRLIGDFRGALNDLMASVEERRRSDDD